MSNRAIATRALAENAAPPSTAAANLALNLGHGLFEKKISPPPHGRGIDVLVAAQCREAVGECDDDRWHRPATDQAVKPLGDILSEVLPVGMCEPACREANHVDQQGQPSARVPCRNINIHRALRRVAEQVSLKHMAVNAEPDHSTRGLRR